jgi:hypothetical protein
VTKWDRDERGGGERSKVKERSKTRPITTLSLYLCKNKKESVKKRKSKR